MSIPFDGDQRKAIEVDLNAVVMAGAGSGKTAVLAERFFWLLQNRGARIDEILTLTFTQKAAADMYDRIYERLRSEGEGALVHLRDFDRAQISTLDSFCAQLVRNSAELFGLAPELRYDEEAVARLAEDMSLDFLLDNLEQPALKELLRWHDFETLWKGLFTSLAQQHFHLAGQEELPSMARRQIEQCRQDIDRLWADFQSQSAELLALAPRTKTIRENQLELRSVLELESLLREERYGEAAERFDGRRLNIRGASGAEDLLTMKELALQLRVKLSDLRLLASTLQMRDILLQIFELIDHFRRAFVQKKRSMGLVTFRDVAELAVQALLQNKALRQFYKSKFRYIMIDEFQDNNRLQKQLLYLLAERRELCEDTIPEARQIESDKLFFVGDEKQSIYRFRSADVSVFAGLHRELEAAGGKTMPLDGNYRSEPGLVRLFNRLFSTVMAGASRDYEARYQVMEHRGSVNPITPEVHLFLKPMAEAPADRKSYLSGEEAEAFTVAAFLRDAVQQGRFTVMRGESPRAAEYEDFAVLLRSTGNQIHYERMFRHFGIPYSTPNVRSLFMEAPSSDFYLLLQLAVHPEDRAAYAGLLRSPFVNISDETFLRLLLSASPGAAPFSGIDADRIPPADRRKLEKGRELLLFVREKADRLSLAELIHQLWYACGYRYFILQDPRSHNYLEYYDYFMKLAERADRQGDPLAGFLDFLRQNLGQYKRLEDLEILKSEATGVQLLTIHKAKGLQFPIVVLADTGNRGRDRRGSQPYYLSDRFGITVNLGQGNYFSLEGEKEAKAKDLAEAKRLLYVALTRARHHLILSGVLKSANQRSAQAHLGMLLEGLGLDPEALFQGSALVLPVSEDRESPCLLKLEPIREIRRDEFLATTGRAARKKPEQLAALYGGEPIRRPALRKEYSVSEICALLDPLLERSGLLPAAERRLEVLVSLPVDALLAQQDLETHFGSLTHHLLARWLDDPSAPCPAPEWTRIGIAREHREICLDSAVRLCRGFFDSALGRLALTAQSCETEYPFVYLWEGQGGPLYISGQVDLFFHTADRTYLVDFKTDRMYREGQYAGQLGLYALACEQLTRMPLTCLLFLLRGAREIAVGEKLDWPDLFKRIAVPG